MVAAGLLTFKMLLPVVLCFSWLVCSASAQTGAVRLVHNSDMGANQSHTSGIVEVRYPYSAWGTICSDGDFGWTEAHVICHQLGYSDAVSYSDTGSTTAYGHDYRTQFSISQVSCSSSEYYTVTQCSISENTYCFSNNQVTVECSSTRLWDSNTYSGNIRLTGGQYSNEGLLEVYCNDEWGTVCDDNFDSTAAQVACSQLGYNSYFSFDKLSSIQGTKGQSIWLNNVNQCSGYSCLASCSSCSTTDYNNECDHSEDVTLVCDYDSSSFSSYAEISDTCDYIDLGGLAKALVTGIIVACVICLLIVIAIIAIPLCICCCLGVGIGAAVGRRSTTNVVSSTYQPMGPAPHTV